MHMGSAKLAGIGGSVLVPMVLRHTLARHTVGPVRVALLEDVIQTGGIVGEVLVEMSDRVSFHTQSVS